MVVKTPVSPQPSVAEARERFTYRGEALPP